MNLIKATWKFVDSVNYVFGGAYKRIYQTCVCPCCGAKAGAVVDGKRFHCIVQCFNCGILHRFPNETASEMADFYQDGYDESGITTELPTDQQLAKYLDSNFKNSPKDFSYHIEILKSLGLKQGDKLLDYGANWGYATYQFLKSGFVTDAFEMSRPRAAFGKKLGLEISTRFPDIPEKYEMVYSCHVLEHVPNPLESLQKMLALVKVGGMVVGHTPNGSEAFRKQNSKLFHRLWGRVHPVLLTGPFVSSNFGENPLFISSVDFPEIVGKWDRKSTSIGLLDGPGLFFAIVRAN